MPKTSRDNETPKQAAPPVEVAPAASENKREPSTSGSKQSLEALGAASQVEKDFLRRSPEETPMDELAPIPALADEPLWDADPDPVIPYQWRPLFPLFLIAICVWLSTLFLDDLRYSRVNKITNLGNIESGCTTSFYKKAKHNLFVNIDGIFPQPKMSTTGRVKFEQRNYLVALGCDLFVAVNAKWFKKFQKQGGGRFSAQGRLVNFFKTPSLTGLRRYYERYGAFEFTKNTYLLYDKDEPRHHWWMVLVYLLLFGVSLTSLWRFFAQIRRLLAQKEGEET